MIDKEDVLNRGSFVERVTALAEVTSYNKQCCCFSINGRWGCGKTYVLDRIEKELSARQNEETGRDRYFICHYNCWRYDYYEEPLIAIIAAILDATEKDKKILSPNMEDSVETAITSAKRTLVALISEFSKNKVGVDLPDLINQILEENDNNRRKRDNKVNDTFFDFNKAIQKTQENIKRVADTRTIVLVVDELDRCLPEYAIKVLERLHHLFDGMMNIVMIIAIDKQQLNHSLMQIYGDNIDSDRYLRKFVSFELTLDNGEPSNYIEKYRTYSSLFDIENTDRNMIEAFLKDIFEGIDIRTQEELFKKAETMHRLVYAGIQEEASEMLFEMLVLCFAEKEKSGNLESIIYDNRYRSNRNPSKNQEFTNKIIKYRRNAEEGTEWSIGGKTYKTVEGIMGRAFFWVASLYSEIEGNSCYPFYIEKGNQIKQNQLTLVKEVYELLRY